MSDEEGQFPLTSLNSWETEVVRAELRRPNVRGWYRNPSRAAVDSLGIAYRDGEGNWRSMHPDFVFFHEVQGKMVASIVDPHGLQLGDADIKLKALAAFADAYGDRFHRVEALAKVDNHMKVLDMQVPAVRDAVLTGKQRPVDIYFSNLSIEYDSKEHAALHRREAERR
jgi:hypothetical protein